MVYKLCHTAMEFKQAFRKIGNSLPLTLIKITLVEDEEKGHSHFLYAVRNVGNFIAIDSPTNYSGTGSHYLSEMEEIFQEIRNGYPEEHLNYITETIPHNVYTELKDGFYNAFKEGGI